MQAGRPPASLRQALPGRGQQGGKAQAGAACMHACAPAQTARLLHRLLQVCQAAGVVLLGAPAEVDAGAGHPRLQQARQGGHVLALQAGQRRAGRRQ